MKLYSGADGAGAIETQEGAERRVLSYGGAMMAVRFDFEAGVTTEPHSHVNEQIGYVIFGELDLFVEGDPPRRLGPGSTYYLVANTRHYVKTLARTAVLDCFSPIREDFLSEHEIGEMDSNVQDES